MKSLRALLQLSVIMVLVASVCVAEQVTAADYARAEQFRTRAEQFERQAEKAAAAGRSKEADEARANAEQWRQWADAAAEALTRRS